MPLALPDFNLSDEQREFRDTLRRFFEVHAPITEVRRVLVSGSGVAADLWKRACEELGLPGLAIAERDGGQGFGLVELAIALAETGRSLAPLPLLACAGLAGRAIAAVADPGEAGEWLGPVARGSIATLAWVESSGDWTPAGIGTEVHSDAGSHRLCGEKRFVLDGLDAERFFVVAREPGTQGLRGLGLFAVERDAPGLVHTPLEGLDPTRKLTTIALADVPAKPVGRPGTDGAGLERALEEATVLLCAEMVGGMQRVLETAVEYARTRFQFGRAIGSFQAIKHKCADMLIDFEAARTATDAALQAAACDDPERSVLASVAKAHTGPAYARSTTENVQIHGGVGYTWEYDAHLYFRRARSSEVLLGDATLHRERLAHELAHAGEAA